MILEFGIATLGAEKGSYRACGTARDFVRIVCGMLALCGDMRSAIAPKAHDRSAYIFVNSAFLR